MRQIEDDEEYIIDVKCNMAITVTEGELRKYYKGWDDLSNDEKVNKAEEYAGKELYNPDDIYFECYSSPFDED